MIYECHGHIILDGVAYTGAVARHQNGVDFDFVRSNLKRNAEHGVVFYRDGGDKHGVSAYAKTVAAEYGIDYLTPIYIIHKKGYYGNMFGRAFENMSEYRQLVAEAFKLGADFIKITASGLLAFASGGTVTGPSMTSEELTEMVNIAHGEGFAVMVHANGADNIKRAAESGADSIEHGYYMDSSALSIIAQTGSIWVPTTATSYNLIGSGSYNDNILRAIAQGHKAAISEAASLGVSVACGSDAGAFCVPQGQGALDELAILNSLGVDPTQGNLKLAGLFRRK